jgi:hypothetical protein
MVPSPPATTTTSPKPAPSNDPPKACTKEPSPSPQPTNRKRKNREEDDDDLSSSGVLFRCVYSGLFLFQSTPFTKSTYRTIKKPRRLAHIRFPAANQSLVSKVKALCQVMPFKRADRILYPPASETVKDVTEIFKELDVMDSFNVNGETSFPRKDYTPYVTYVDCRDKGCPSSRPGSPSSSNNGGDE